MIEMKCIHIEWLFEGRKILKKE